MNKEMYIDLKSCPFCGGKPVIKRIGVAVSPYMIAYGLVSSNYRPTVSIVCPSCGCTVKGDERSCVSTWNKRVGGTI